MSAVRPRAFATQRGFSLIEVLVTILVLSVGLLGLAGLQLQSLKFNQSAYLRSQATLLAYDVLDRLRANEAAGGNYLVAYATAPSGTTNCVGTTANCSASDMATFDINQWKCSLGNWDSQAVCSTTLGISGLLPAGDGLISRNGNVYTVAIRWADRAGVTEELSMSTEL
jgi:type IV pilus assembly protein PilV